MYVVIGGAGDASTYLGRMLTTQGHEVAFIERDYIAAAAAAQIDALVVEGSVVNPKALQDAEVERCDYYVALVTEDSSNIVSCSLANYHGCQTIARIKSPSLAGEPFSTKFTHIGVDVALCPALIAALQISRVFAFPSRLRALASKGISTYHGVVEADSQCCGDRLLEIDLPRGSVVVSVFRGVEHLLPSEDLVLQPEDELLVLFDGRAQPPDVEQILGVKMTKSREVKDVFIAGVSDTALTLSERLVQSDISVAIMSLNRQQLQVAAEKLPAASAIVADPLGRGVLKREGIERFDVLMAMGPSMERNILAGVLAKQSQVPTVLSLVDRIDLKDSVEKTLVDDVVVPNLLLVKTIGNLIAGEGPLRKRSLQMRDIMVRAIDVTPKSRCTGKTIGSFTPSIGDFFIAGVSKGEAGVIPDGEYEISKGDKLFVLYPSRGYDAVKRWLLG